MATYTLIPSSYSASESSTYASNESRMYANTSSTNYATISMSGGYFYLGGFDPTPLIDENIISVVIKIKWNSSTKKSLAVFGSFDGSVKLSEDVFGVAPSSGITTFTLTASIETVAQYLLSGTLCIGFYYGGNSTNFYIYGAEVIVTTDMTPKPNKIVYGNDVLIDLTNDTVTRADVLSGVSFHLPSGKFAVGTAIISMNTKTAYPSSYGITFRELANEPTWFLVACMSSETTTYSTITFFMLYDGTTTYIMNGVGSSGSRTKRAVYSGSNAFTFSYTSGVLAISGNINNFKIPSTYETYTLYYI